MIINRHATDAPIIILLSRILFTNLNQTSQLLINFSIMEDVSLDLEVGAESSYLQQSLATLRTSMEVVINLDAKSKNISKKALVKTVNKMGIRKRCQHGWKMKDTRT
jgi:hypothetical protein